MIRILSLLVIGSFLLFGCTSVKRTTAAQPSSAAQMESFLEQPLPLDTLVVKGKLNNGLTYYFRQNHKPENRVELRLVVNAGSILEDDDQQGLAHLCEHMAFNGTKHFHKQALVNFLESIGMRFGADLNAYTSFDETVYMLQIPTDNDTILDKGFLVLEDWAHNVTYDPEEIDKERGVVIEEWRLGRGASQRMRDKQLPILLKGSRYAHRLPIGQKAVLDTFKHESLTRFYHDWYRPDLMAVVVVGDISVAQAEQLIHKHFDQIPEKQNPKERKFYPVPDHDRTLYAIATDPEAASSSVSVYYLLDRSEDKTNGDYRQSILEQVYNSMFNQRLRELSRKADPPFIFAYSQKGMLVRTKDAYILGAMVKDGQIERGLETLLTEARRVSEFGFTQSELERQKKAMLRYMEKLFNERNKTESRSYASEYIRNFLQNEPIPGIAYEYELYKKFVPGIKLEEINSLGKSWMKDNNRVILVNAPQKPDVPVPTEQDLKQVLDKVARETVTAYKDDVVNAPLIERPPKPGKIVKEKKYEDLGVTEWTLSNGVKVVLKPTDFKNDEIRFTAFSPGGYSLADDKDLVPARIADDIVYSSGLGKFSHTQLQKLLAGKIARVSPNISNLTEGISGSASPKDLETMFQLVYLSFTEPRMDSTAFLSYKTKYIASMENKNADPAQVYQDSVTVIFTGNHPRYRPWDASTAKQFDLVKSFQFYKDRFGDASDFTFIFVGNFTLEQIRPLIEKYLGGLPALHRNEHWMDRTFDYPSGVIRKTIKKGLEPKSINTIIFSGKAEWSEQNETLLTALTRVLTIRLREKLREEKSGLYSIGVRGRLQHYPRQRYTVSIRFGCDPKRVDELTKEMFVQIDSLKNYGYPEEYLEKVKKMGVREFETNLKKNSFWLHRLKAVYFNHEDVHEIMRLKERLQKLTMKDIQLAAEKFLNENNYVQVVLVPEK